MHIGEEERLLLTANCPAPSFKNIMAKYKDVFSSFLRQLTCLGKPLGYFILEVGKGKYL